MEDRGIEANAQLLQPVTAIDVFVRLCLNLLNLYRSSVSHPYCLLTVWPVSAVDDTLNPAFRAFRES